MVLLLTAHVIGGFVVFKDQRAGFYFFSNLIESCLSSGQFSPLCSLQLRHIWMYSMRVNHTTGAFGLSHILYASVFAPSMLLD